MTIALKSLEALPDGQYQIVHTMLASTGEPSGITFLERPLSLAIQAELYQDELRRNANREEIANHPVNQFLTSLHLPLIKWLRQEL